MRVVAHGGVGGPASHADGCRAAVQAVLAALDAADLALDAAVAGAVILEDDPRFNAGTGSSYRLDGKTIEMDAAVMDGGGRIGAVAAIRRVKNPVLVARRVADSPHILLAGEPAVRFARAQGFPDHDPATREAREKYEEVVRQLTKGEVPPSRRRWLEIDLSKFWNFEVPYAKLAPTGTIGVAVHALGRTAVALSTGGASPMLAGRVGDTPLPGAGFWAGPAGSVAATGIGEEIARKLLSKWVYDRIEEGASPAGACREGVALYPDEIPIGLIAVTPAGWGAANNREMPWAAWTGDALVGP
ncbi:MAG: isoaspartyl peptidase/L-asparaginase [Planctomycetes bacterium]|nr:isoaspartyl peptidase/L-asparaginase [Planctomycetota bacterium]